MKNNRFVRLLGYLEKWAIIGVFMGLVIGVSTILFSQITDYLEYHLLISTVSLESRIPVIPFEATWNNEIALLQPLITCLGCLLGGLLVYVIAPETEGEGTGAAIATFHNPRGGIRSRVPPVKAIASALTIGSGGSVGREGPMGQIGAGVGSIISSILKLDPRSKRIAIAAGLGAGIGTIFKAPLGGALFGMEVLYKRDFEVEALVPAFIASVVGYSIYGAYSGWRPLFFVPQTYFQNPLELLFYTILGVVCAVTSIVYVQLLHRFRSLFKSLRIPRIAKPAIGGLIVGIVGIFVPQIVEGGYVWIKYLLNGEVSSWFDNTFLMAIMAMIVIFLLKMIVTSITIGSGGSGGIFTPTIAVGATIGMLLGEIFAREFPMIIFDRESFLISFTIVGMMAFFGGISKCPLAAMIMVSEITGDYGLLLPAMLTTALAYILTGDYTMYSEQVETKADSPAHVGEYMIHLLRMLKVRNAMRTRYPTISPTISLRDAAEIMRMHGVRAVPVVEDSRLVGVISMEDVYKVRDRKLEDVRVNEIMVRNVIVAYPDESLLDVMHRIVENQISILPVVERGDKRLLGVVTMQCIIRAYDKAMEELEEAREEEK